MSYLEKISIRPATKNSTCTCFPVRLYVRLSVCPSLSVQRLECVLTLGCFENALKSGWLMLF